ncbi:MAG: SIMPL domain-containing protein [Bacteroidaceae bacterium]|nr:SIMPL domain-containing protein [Bacteroidaceae bacterium]
MKVKEVFKSNHIIPACVIALGIFCMGWFIYAGISKLANKDRTVSVCGLAERQVKADRVTWPLSFKVSGNDLQALYSEINTKNKIITDYLRKNGFTDGEISTSAPSVSDTDTEEYSSDNKKARYFIGSSITVMTTKVDLVNDLTNKTGELIEQGVTLESSTPSFDYTGLNTIKPAMIEEATKNAREAAEKFAKDSESSLGKIMTARQGVFEIEDLDEYTPIYKTVRVVTAIDYFLDN